jgi:TM2 domain-containing membrane protein YozV
MIEYDINRKSTDIAIALWLFLGWIGAHRIYLGISNRLVVFQMIGVVVLLFVANMHLYNVGVFLWMAIAGIGLTAIFDIFRIPGWVKDANRKVLEDICGTTKKQPAKELALEPVAYEKLFFGALAVIMLAIIFANLLWMN